MIENTRAKLVKEVDQQIIQAGRLSDWCKLGAVWAECIQDPELATVLYTSAAEMLKVEGTLKRLSDMLVKSAMLPAGS